MSDDEALAKQAAIDEVEAEEAEAEQSATKVDAPQKEVAKPNSNAAATPAKPAAPVKKAFVPHTEMAPMTEAAKVVYCPIDGMSPDFCDYGGKFDQCKPWLIENYPDLYPELAGLSLSDAKEKAGEAKADEDKKTKELPGGKKKKAPITPKLTVRVQRRQGKKMITTVIGLDMFDVKLESAAKIFKKKFACGSAAVKGAPGMPDCVEIQGDPGKEELIAVFKKEYPELPYKKIEWLLP